MTEYSPVSLSLLVRLWFNTNINCWQGELKEIASNKTVRFTGLDQLTRCLSRLTETGQLPIGNETGQDQK